MNKRLIFHVDINSAFLSWEAARRVAMGEPDLRLIPSVVGGDPSNRTSIVTAKSIPAKKCGINTGEPVSMALRKCPELVVVKSDFELYVRSSRAFKAICQEYTPDMESFSIDEVFLDMSGMELLHPDPVALAYEIKDRIKNELGFTCNVGIGYNKLCAKMASDFEKPDRVHTLFPEEIEDKMWPLPVGELFGCGKSTAARLDTMGINTIGELAHMNMESLLMVAGDKGAAYLHRAANGIDESPVVSEPEEAKGYSAETTVEENITELTRLLRILLAQSDVVASRLRAKGVKCGCVCVKYRDSAFRNKSHQRKLADSTDVTDVIYRVAEELITECWGGEPVRLIGLALTDIDDGEFEQMSFIVDDRKEKLRKLDSAMDSIRMKFGNDSVKRASTIDVEGRINRRHKAEQNSK